MIPLRTRVPPASGLLAGLAMAAAPLLAGLGGAGGWSVGVFGLIAALSVALIPDPAAWTGPVRLAAAAGAAGGLAALLWGTGRGISALTGATPGWGALPPILLACAGAALGWRSRNRDARR